MKTRFNLRLLGDFALALLLALPAALPAAQAPRHPAADDGAGPPQLASVAPLERLHTGALSAAAEHS